MINKGEQQSAFIAGGSSGDFYQNGEGEWSKYDEGGFGYVVEVHILAGIDNKPSGGGDISIENIWFRNDSIDDQEENPIPLLVS
jgi:hypothetical protein